MPSGRRSKAKSPGHLAAAQAARSNSAALAAPTSITNAAKRPADRSAGRQPHAWAVSFTARRLALTRLRPYFHGCHHKGHRAAGLPGAPRRRGARARRSSRASSAPRQRSASELRIPGFRKGKVPGPMVIQRMGREAVLEQAVRDSLPEWYEEAIMRSGVSSIGDPKLDMDEHARRRTSRSGSRSRSPSRRRRGSASYKGLEVGRREPEVPGRGHRPGARAACASRSRASRPSTGRWQPATSTIVDFVGKRRRRALPGRQARDYMLEIGAGRLVEGFEEQLDGRRQGGEPRTVEIDFPEDYRAEDLAGQARRVRGRGQGRPREGAARPRRRLRVRGKRVRHRRRAACRHRAQAAPRAGALDRGRVPGGGASTRLWTRPSVDLPDDLVAARAEEMWERTERALRARASTPRPICEVTGKTREQMIEETKQDAARQLARESVLEAVADAEGDRGRRRGAASRRSRRRPSARGPSRRSCSNGS